MIAVETIETIVTMAMMYVVLFIFLLVTHWVTAKKNHAGAAITAPALSPPPPPPGPEPVSSATGQIAYFQKHGVLPIPPAPAPAPLTLPPPPPPPPPPPSTFYQRAQEVQAERTPGTSDYFPRPYQPRQEHFPRLAEGMSNGLVPRADRRLQDPRLPAPGPRPFLGRRVRAATSEEGPRPEAGAQSQQQQEQQKTTPESGNADVPSAPVTEAAGTSARTIVPEVETAKVAAPPSQTSEPLKETGNTPTGISPPGVAGIEPAPQAPVRDLYYRPANALLELNGAAARNQLSRWLVRIDGQPEQLGALSASDALKWLDNVRLTFSFWLEWVCLSSDGSWDLLKLGKADVEAAAPIVRNVCSALEGLALRYQDAGEYFRHIAGIVERVKVEMEKGYHTALSLEAATILENLQRLEQQRLEAQRLEQQRLENQRLEEQRPEEQRPEEQRLEEQRPEEQRPEEQRLEEQRLEEQRLEEQRLEEQRLEQQRLEQQRLEAERQKQQEFQEQQQRFAQKLQDQDDEDEMAKELREELEHQQDRDQKQQAKQRREFRSATRQRRTVNRQAAELAEPERRRKSQQDEPQQQQPQQQPQQQHPQQQQNEPFIPWVGPPTTDQKTWSPPEYKAQTKAPVVQPPGFKYPQAYGSWTPPPASRPAAQLQGGKTSTFPPGYQPSRLRNELAPAEEEDEDDEES